MTTERSQRPNNSGRHKTPRIKVPRDPHEVGWAEAAEARGMTLAAWLTDLADRAARRGKKKDPQP